MEPKIIVYDANVSLKPYLEQAADSASFEKHMESLGFEVQVEQPRRKIGFLQAISRSS
jgi:hypothetical protein